MPIPVIALVVAVVVIAVGGIGAAVLKLRSALANKKLTILGATRVGKTTLFRILRDGKLSRVTPATVDAEPGTTFTLKVSGKDMHFQIPKDLPGHGGVAFPDWKKAFIGSDHVWYLFRADLIAAQDRATVDLVTVHLKMFENWLPAMNGPRPKILLIGTFSDKSSNGLGRHDDLAIAVANADPIKAEVVKLGHAGLVVGSMATPASARALLKGIVERIA